MYKLLVATVLMLTTVILADLSYYEILGVPETATILEIRQAYFKLVLKYHPDKNPNEEQKEKFMKVAEAYEILKNQEQRDAYDKRHRPPKPEDNFDKLFHLGLYHDDPNVDNLSPINFDDHFQGKLIFINYYSPFCPPCQQVSPHWKNIAEMYRGIITIAAFNCKKHDEFCFRAMNVDSYPTLYFHPDGQKNQYQEFTGARTTEAMDEFLSSFLKERVPLQVVTEVQDTDQPIAYILGKNRLVINGLYRIAYQLRGLITLYLVEDDTLRAELAQNECTTVLYKYRGYREFQSDDESEILNLLSNALPKIELINPETLKKIREDLRSGSSTVPWVLYFTTKGNDHDRLLVQQKVSTHPNLNFGEVDCDIWTEIYNSLEVEHPPSYAVLKPGGSYLSVPRLSDVVSAAGAGNFRSISASEFQEIQDSDPGTWVFLVAPVDHEWAHLFQPFVQASMLYREEPINLGLLVCSVSSNEYCREVNPDRATVLVQHRAKKYQYHRDKINEDELLDFVKLIQESSDMPISVAQVLEIQGLENREYTWLVAFIPENCNRACDELRHEWRIVSRHLRPLDSFKVRALECSWEPFCNNIREPAARLYSAATGSNYAVSLRQVGLAPFILEWAMKNYDESVLELKWQTFRDYVISAKPYPSRFNGSLPWLVYFHSPRCYHCHERYSYFGIAAILLNTTVQRGRVNCYEENGLCHTEEIEKYPTLRLYFGNEFVSVEIGDYQSVLNDIKPHIQKHDPRLLDTLKKPHVHDEM